MLSSEFDTERSVDPQNTPMRQLMPGLTRSPSTPGNSVSFYPHTTGHLPVPVSTVAEPMNTLPAIRSTGSLTTGHLSTLPDGATPLTTGRMPVVIHGAGRRRSAPVNTRPLKTKHRVILHASIVCIVVLFVLTTLVTFLPIGENGQALGVGGLLQKMGVMHMTSSDTQNSALVGAQAATATAIMQQDGFDPGAAVSAQYNASLGGVAATGDNFPYGQCTYWADYRYHELTGYWVAWGGNAYQWAAGAAATPGWIVSSTPHVPSIIVFAPGVQYASYVYGHVAVVEGINANGSIHTSNMNVYGYPYATRVDLTNYVGAGVQFVYHQ
jgi:surface antigen